MPWRAVLGSKQGRAGHSWMSLRLVRRWCWVVVGGMVSMVTWTWVQIPCQLLPCHKT